jgi:polynucleotide 5'-hydroxyl-kinase GRC3/NOL9
MGKRMRDKFNGFYKVLGPSTIKIIDGKADVLGYSINQATRIVIPLNKIISVYFENASVDVLPSFSNLIKDDSDFIRNADNIYRKISNGKKIMIIGSNDSGKSTLAAYFINKFKSDGSEFQILTTDVGQNEVYCPAYMAKAKINYPYIPGWRNSVKDVEVCFVGSFSPSINQSKYVDCLLKQLKLNHNLIIDTDGWIDNKGLLLKINLANELKVDHVIGLNFDEDAKKHVIEGLRNRDTKVIFENKLVNNEKNRAQRLDNRNRLISSCILESKKRLIDLNKVEIINDEYLKDGVIASVYSIDNKQYFTVIQKVEDSIAVILTHCEGEIKRIEAGFIKIDLKKFNNLIK